MDVITSPRALLQAPTAEFIVFAKLVAEQFPSAAMGHAIDRRDVFVRRQLHGWTSTRWVLHSNTIRAAG
jgi:hypothetical protein